MLSSKGQEESVYIKPAERIEGCELVSIDHPKDEKNNSYYLDFTFKEKRTGGTFRHRVFDLTIQSPNVDDEKFKKIQGWNMGSLKHIVKAFVPDIEELEAPDWKGVIKLIKQKLGVGEGLTPKFKGIECAIKVVVNGKYPAFPLFPAFISTEKTPRDFTTTQYDKYIVDGVNQTSSAPMADDDTDPFSDDVDEEVDLVAVEVDNVNDIEDDF